LIIQLTEQVVLPEWGSLEVLYDTADGQKALTLFAS